ncbi:MAG: hypothetical protein HKM03_01370 [Steroidobacteraceae bacterium]|nr:hypothetical protein [Steroidobacteraceae bacterium]
MPEFVSPACSMHEASDVYMGYAGADELIAALGELIELERAGRRLARDCLGDGDLPGLAPGEERLRSMRRNHARSYAVLCRHLLALGGKRSRRTAATCLEVASLTHPTQRLDALKRNQSGSVLKLRELLPRVRNDRLHTDLSAIRRSHEIEIGLADDSARS